MAVEAHVLHRGLLHGALPELGDGAGVFNVTRTSISLWLGG